MDVAQANPLAAGGAFLADLYGKAVGTPSLCNSGLATTALLPNGPLVPAVIQPWIGQFPLPQNSAAANNYSFQDKSGTREDYTQLRMDQNISASDTFFGRYTFDDDFVHSPFGNINSQTTGAAMPQYNTIGRSRNQYTTLGENHIFSPVLLNSFRLSYSRTNFRVFPEPKTSVLNPFGPLIGPNWSLVPGGLAGIAPGGGNTAISFWERHPPITFRICLP